MNASDFLFLYYFCNWWIENVTKGLHEEQQHDKTVRHSIHFKGLLHFDDIHQRREQFSNETHFGSRLKSRLNLNQIWRLFPARQTCYYRGLPFELIYQSLKIGFWFVVAESMDALDSCWEWKKRRFKWLKEWIGVEDIFDPIIYVPFDSSILIKMCENWEITFKISKVEMNFVLVFKSTISKSNS